MDTIYFARSYNAIPHPSDKEWEELLNADPFLDQDDTPQLYAKLVEVKLMKDRYLLEKRFGDLPFLGSAPIELPVLSIKSGSDSLSIKFKTKRDEPGKDGVWMIVGNSMDSAAVSILRSTDNLGMLVEDIVPGGFKEVLLLRKHYFMNVDFFELFILEVYKRRQAK